MATILLWIGIVLIVAGWGALSLTAAKRLSRKEELARFPQRAKAMVLRSNYCRFTIIAGILLLMVSLLV